MTQTIDPITLEVLTQGLISVVREMRATVMRTAKSVAIYEAKDFSCGLFAPDSQVVAQSEDIGSHVVPMPWTVQSAMAKLVVSEAYMASSIDALHLRGGYGFMSEYEADRDLLDAAGGKIYSGTSEIQRNIIARFLGL